MPFDLTPQLEPWQRHLLDAAKIVRERWRQGDGGWPGGPRCAMGAINEARAWADCPFIISPPEFEALRNFLGTFSIQDWNDAPGRTAEEVAIALERAAQVKVTAR